MVMFHADIPYLVAQQRGEVQKALLEEFTATENVLSKIDIDAAMTTVSERLVPIEFVRDGLAVHTS
jgi:hypothetical protein